MKKVLSRQFLLPIVLLVTWMVVAQGCRVEFRLSPQAGLEIVIIPVSHRT